MTNRKCSDMRIGGIGIFCKCVDGHPSEIMVIMAVDTEVKKDQFLLDNILGA